LKIALIAAILVLPAFSVKAEEVVCRITSLNVDGSGRVEVLGDKELNYRMFSLTNPNRLVFDFKGSSLQYNGGKLYDQSLNSRLIRAVRISQFSINPGVVRLVIEPLTDKPARITRTGEGMKLIVDLGETPNPVIESIKEEKSTATINPAPAPTSQPEVPFMVSPTGDGKFAVDVKAVSRENIIVKKRSYPLRLQIDVGEIFNDDRLASLGHVNVESGPVSSYESLRDGAMYRLILYLNSGAQYREEALPEGMRLVVYKLEDDQPIHVLSSSDETEVVESGVFLLDPGANAEVGEVKAEASTPEEKGEVTVEALALPPSIEAKIETVKPAPIVPIPLGPAWPILPEGIDYRLVVGEMKLIPTMGLERVSVGNPAVISVNVISQRELLVTALAEGQTALMTWEEGGRHQVKWIEVSANVNLPMKQLGDIIGEPDVKANIVGKNVILEGTVKTEADKIRAENIAASFGDKVVNLVEVLKPDQVMVKVRFVEIDKKSVKDLFNQVSGGARAQSGDFTFSIISAIIDPELPGGGLVDASVKPGIVNHDVGDVRYDPIDVALDYLETERKANILSEPNVVALSGKDAKFRVGGEIPYTYQNEKGINVVEFKEFGVELNMTPTVNSHGGIYLKVNPVVRTVDLSLAIGGIPGFRTRTMTTEVQLNNGETIVIGGLIQSEITKVVAKIPFLGDLPILGDLFRSKKFQEDETELLVFLTPVILKGDENQPAFMLEGVSSDEREEMLKNKGG